MNTALLISAIAVGFLGSFHCIGMCGPIAIALPGRDLARNKMLAGRILYNLGRVTTYSIMGLAAGLIGYSFSIKGFQSELSILTGITIVLMVLLTNENKLTARLSRYTGKFTGAIKLKFKKLFSNGTPSVLYLIGVLNGLLPCGFVYLALAGALATGHYLEGAMYMALFGLGTLPAMFTLSVAGHLIGKGIGNKIRKASPIIAIALAALLIYRGNGEKPNCCEGHHSVESRAK